MSDAAARPVVPQVLHDRRPGRESASAAGDSLSQYLAECRKLVLHEIEEITPRTRHGQRLYELMRDYPLRGGKALRPALCMATCRALGGSLASVMRSAAAIELYHNAFLVHDDVEDRSALRRAEPTLHRKYGVPIAINVGDGMLAVSMSALLGNTEVVGVGKALRVLETVSRMARESAEGQMIELDWIAGGIWTLTDESYVRMVYKKTTWYSFITPVRIGVIASGASNDRLNAFGRFASLLGVAFQIQDDALNLVGNTGDYGKEIAGDLWEGKHTLILIHTMRSASAPERERAVLILKKPRPPMDFGNAAALDDVPELPQARHAQRTLTQGGHRRRSAALDEHAAPATYKTREDVEFLNELIVRYGGITYASAVAERRAARAARTFEAIERRLTPSAHTTFLRELVRFVTKRTC